jgi:thiosulfate/3-mercaptopyruvate sulfurtransferase
MPPSALITPEALASTLWNGHVKPVDASWFLNDPRRGRADYLQRHIPRAMFFDIEDISDHNSPYPHMLPSVAEFEMKVGRLGIGNHDKVVVYDSEGLFSAARVWWMFRVFGHSKVQVLEGGLPAWLAARQKTASGEEDVQATRFTARFTPKLYRSGEEIFTNLTSRAEQLIDARSPGRFRAQEQEPRPGLKSGHIPGALNFPWGQFVHQGRLRPPEEIRAIFTQGGLDLSRPVVATCGSGISACTLALALFEAGRQDAAVYDGSWAEWGSIDGLPVAA